MTTSIKSPSKVLAELDRLGRLAPMVGVEQTVEDAYSSFVKREPAVLAGLVAGPVFGVLAWLVQRGYIGNDQASYLQSTIVGFVVMVAIALQGFVLRHFVGPAWKQLTGRDLPDVNPDAVMATDPSALDDAKALADAVFDSAPVQEVASDDLTGQSAAAQAAIAAAPVA